MTVPKSRLHGKNHCTAEPARDCSEAAPAGSTTRSSIKETTMTAAFEPTQPTRRTAGRRTGARVGRRSPLGRHRPATTPPRTSSGSAAASPRSTPWPAAAPRSCGSSCTEHRGTYTNALGALTGNQAVQQVKAGLRGHLPLRLAGRRRRQPLRPHLPGPVACTRPTRCPPVVRRINNALLRADQIEFSEGIQTVDGLAGADRRRRRGRLRRPAERLRADEVHDRRRRRGRALGGPARLGEEVRPPRRQGARSPPRSTSAP